MQCNIKQNNLNFNAPTGTQQEIKIDFFPQYNHSSSQDLQPYSKQSSFRSIVHKYVQQDI